MTKPNVSIHPAIATTESPMAYDPRLTAKPKTKHTVEGAMVAHRARLDLANERRREAVAAFNGGKSLRVVAHEYGVLPRTILEWAAKFKEAPRRRPEPKPISIDDDRLDFAGLNHGTGGAMSDRQVREATMRLCKAIVALQRKLKMPTFTYVIGDKV